MSESWIAPIGVQSYTLREALTADFDGVTQAIGDADFIGVEAMSGCLGATPRIFASRLKTLGLELIGAHTRLPVGAHRNQALDFVADLGCKRLISNKPPESYATLDRVRQTCDLFNAAHVVATESGLSFGLHNHWWEFRQIEGEYVYQVMLEHLDPAIWFEVDTYWVRTAGMDPTQVLAEIGPRVQMLHIKDDPAIVGEPHVAVGDGMMNIPAVIRAAKGTAEWLIVELDFCTTDMLEAVRKSYCYLVGQGLAHGRRDV